MAFNISGNAFLNDSGYVQIFGWDFANGEIPAQILNVGNSAAVTDEKLYLKGALSSNTAEGVIVQVPITRVIGDKIKLKFKYISGLNVAAICLGPSIDTLNAVGSQTFAIYHHGSLIRWSMYYEGAAISNNTTNATAGVEHAIEIEFRSGGGFTCTSDGGWFYGNSTYGNLTTNYLSVAAVSNTGTYDRYIDTLEITGYGTFSVSDVGQEYIFKASGFNPAALSVVANELVTEVGLRYCLSANNVDWGAWSAWLTEAQFQAESSTEDQYMKLEVRFKGSIGATIEEIVVQGNDEVPPTAPVLDTAIRYTSGTTPILSGVGTTGEDLEGEGYAATTIEIYVGSAWYEVKSDCSLQVSGTAITPTSLFVPALGDDSDTVFGFGIIPAASAITAFSTATQMRLRSWDLANNSTLCDAVTITSGGAPEQSTSPSSIAITDTGDGVTWTLTTTGATAGAAIHLYNAADDSLLAILDAFAQTADLAAGLSVYAKALEDGKTLSEATASVAVPSITPLPQITAPVVTLVDLANGTGFTVAADCADGTTNTVEHKELGATAWTTDVEDHAGDISATTVSEGVGTYIVRVTSTVSGRTNVSVSTIAVTNSSDSVAWYRVVQVMRIPGARKMELTLEAINAPKDPR